MTVQPVFHMFPDTGRLRLASQATGGLVPFLVDPTVTPWFLQVVAIGPNCAALGGRAPDLELKVDKGLITSVPAAPETAPVNDGAGHRVATASWTRDTDDVFTVEVDMAGLGVARTWQLRIINTAPEELGFVWTSAGSVQDATHPRLVMEPRVEVEVQVGFAVPDVTVPVANIGTGPLIFTDPVKTDLGAGYSLKSRPDSVAPNSCDALVLAVTKDSFHGPSLVEPFVLDCNEPVSVNKTLLPTRLQTPFGPLLTDRPTVRPTDRPTGEG
ncbi:hypothetical protein [Streptomyces sp. 1331.2]|uniref:hypothetical protein n=1 Tax=Streptomyces sp. 1331.2 TaxID=1938835 RepID=UPI000BC3F15C|nr:hypothetical protein [Streptomyces sp. 1331.2]SOB86326.1 hypothetical protein SAMN06272789_6637 [Streptomyces sp. 1331.2]